MIIITGIVFQQMHYIHNRDLGFSQKSVVTVKLYGSLAKNVRDNKETLKGELLRNHNNIRSVSVSNRLIGERLGYEWFALANSRDEERIDARFIRADDGFVSKLGLTLIEGRNFLPDDTVVYFIINE